MNDFQNKNNVTEVSRISWWMSSFGSATAKPQYAYSNSPSIRRVHQYAPTTSVERTGEHVETCRAYKNKEGRVCYTGTKNLKSTERLACDWVVGGLIFSIVFQSKHLCSIDPMPDRLRCPGYILIFLA